MQLNGNKTLLFLRYITPLNDLLMPGLLIILISDHTVNKYDTIFECVWKYKSGSSRDQIPKSAKGDPSLCCIMHLLRKDLKRANTLLNLLSSVDLVRLRCRPKLKFIRDLRAKSCYLLTPKSI